MKLSEAVDLMARLARAFPAAKIGVETAQVYAEMIEDLELHEASQAVASIMAESTFFPSIAEIRRRVVGDRLELQPPEEAWSDVLAAIGKFGIYRTPTFSNDLTTYALASIGWKNLCNTPTDQLGFVRSQFLKAYAGGEERMMRQGSTAPMLAHHERKRLAGIHDEPTEERGTRRALGDVVVGLFGGDDDD